MANQPKAKLEDLPLQEQVNVLKGLFLKQKEYSRMYNEKRMEVMAENTMLKNKLCVLEKDNFELTKECNILRCDKEEWIEKTQKIISDCAIKKLEDTKWAGTIPKGNDSCKRCGFLALVHDRLYAKFNRLVSKDEDADMLVFHIKDIEESNMVKTEQLNRYIDKLEEKLQSVQSNFEDWRKEVMTTIMLYKSSEEELADKRAHLADLDEKIESYNDRLKSTMPYKMYIMTKTSRQELEDHRLKVIQDIESDEVKAASQKNKGVLAKMLETFGLTDAEKKTLFSLGLNSGTTTDRIRQYLLETSVYHNDRALYERIHDKSAVAGIGVRLMQVGSTSSHTTLLPTRSVLANNHWVHKSNESMANVDLMPYDNAEGTLCKPRAVLIYDPKEDVRVSHEDVNKSIQLAVDIQEKIMISLDYTIRTKAIDNIRLTNELCKLRSTIEKAKYDTLEIATTGTVKTYNTPLLKCLKEACIVMKNYGMTVDSHLHELSRMPTYQEVYQEARHRYINKYCEDTYSDSESSDENYTYSYGSPRV